MTKTQSTRVIGRTVAGRPPAVPQAGRSGAGGPACCRVRGQVRGRVRTQRGSQAAADPAGPHRISRLICGANPFNAGSHLSVFVNYEMSYYTPEPHPPDVAALPRGGDQPLGFRAAELRSEPAAARRGRQDDYLGAATTSTYSVLPEMAKTGVIGVAHHGETTDRSGNQQARRGS